MTLGPPGVALPSIEGLPDPAAVCSAHRPSGARSGVWRVAAGDRLRDRYLTVFADGRKRRQEVFVVDRRVGALRPWARDGGESRPALSCLGWVGTCWVRSWSVWSRAV
jgi:hypothetical protein